MTNYYHIPLLPQHRQLVHGIWQVEHNTAFQTEQIIPKGIIEIIFNFSDSLAIPAQLGRQPYQLSKCFISGFNKVPIKIELPKRHVFFGIQLQPSAVRLLFGAPAAEFLDTTVDATLLDASLHSLWHHLAEQTDFDNRVTAFLAWLTSQSKEVEPREQLINEFLYGTNRHHMTVKELAHTFYYSTRQIGRKVFDATGMNAEEFLLYKKYLHAVSLIHKGQLSLTEIAYDSFFFDQSHFIKTFKSYTDITPGEYKRVMSIVQGHIYQDVR